MYLGVVVTLVTAMSVGVSPRRAKRLRAELGVSRRTLERWRRWWQESVPKTSWWRELRGRLGEEPDVDGLPRTLLDRLVGDEQERVLRCLRLLSPLSHTPLMRQRFAMEG